MSSTWDHYRCLFADPSAANADMPRLQVITSGTVEPVPLTLARRQCRVDPDPTLDPPSHPDDELIWLYLSAAREWAELQLGMVVAPTAVRLPLDAFPAGDLTLESWPILGVSDVTYIDPDTLLLTAVDPAVYRLDMRAYPARLRLNDGQAWPAAEAGTDSISVHYELGYSALGDSPQSAPLPARIKLAILLVLTHFYDHRSEQTELVLQTLPVGARSMLVGLSVRRGFA